MVAGRRRLSAQFVITNVLLGALRSFVERDVRMFRPGRRRRRGHGFAPLGALNNGPAGATVSGSRRCGRGPRLEPEREQAYKSAELWRGFLRLRKQIASRNDDSGQSYRWCCR